MVFLWYMCQIWCVLFSPQSRVSPYLSFSHLSLMIAWRSFPHFYYNGAEHNLLCNSIKNGLFSGRSRVPPRKAIIVLLEIICHWLWRCTFFFSYVFKARNQTKKGKNDLKKTLLQPTECICWKMCIERYINMDAIVKVGVRKSKASV